MGNVVPFPGKVAPRPKKRSQPLHTYGFSVVFSSTLMGTDEDSAALDAVKVAERMADVLQRAGFEFADPAFSWHRKTE